MLVSAPTAQRQTSCSFNNGAANTICIVLATHAPHQARKRSPAFITIKPIILVKFIQRTNQHLPPPSRVPCPCIRVYPCTLSPCSLLLLCLTQDSHILMLMCPISVNVLISTYSRDCVCATSPTRCGACVEAAVRSSPSMMLPPSTATPQSPLAQSSGVSEVEEHGVDLTIVSAATQGTTGFRSILCLFGVVRLHVYQHRNSVCICCQGSGRCGLCHRRESSCPRDASRAVSSHSLS